MSPASMIRSSRSRQKHSPAFALVLALLFSCFASIAHASVIYDFSADSSIFGVTGSFTYTAPDFVTSNKDVPAAALDTCTSPAGTCGTMQFFADSSGLTGGTDLYDAIGFTVDLSTAFYYFADGIFSTPGSFATVLFGEEQAGRLTIREGANNVPEPAPLALISIGLVALYIARRRQLGSRTGV